MLTIKTSAHIRNADYAKGYRAHPTSTGISLAHIDRRRRAWSAVQLAVRQLRRQWLEERWLHHFVCVTNKGARNR